MTALPIDSSKLKTGQRYQIEFRVGRQKLWRQSVALFLGTYNKGKPNEELVLCYRPLAGTARISTAQVRSMVKVDTMTPKRLPTPVHEPVSS